MRVLHVLHDFLPRHRAGAELYVAHLAQAQAVDHDVAVLCADYAPERVHGSLQVRRWGGLTVFELTNAWAFATFAETYRSPSINGQVAAVLSEFRPDVVHVHNLLTLSLDVPRLAAQRGIPVVATLHDHTLVCPSGGQRVHVAEEHVCDRIEPERCARCFARSPLERQRAASAVAARWSGATAAAAQLARRSPWLTAAAGQLLDRLPRTGGSPTAADLQRRLDYARAATEFVDLFVSPSLSVAEAHRQQGVPAAKLSRSAYGLPVLVAEPQPAPDARIRLGYVGSLVWHKGVHVLLAACARLPPDRYTLEIHGDERTHADYAGLLRRLARGLPVRFCGPFDEAGRAGVYGGLDALVVPSRWPENSPLVIHEARQAGIPVIGARAGGIPELIEDGVDGLVYRADDPADLARALGRLLDDPEAVSRLAKPRREVKTAAQDAAEWSDRYAACLERPRPAPPDVRRVSVLLLTRDGMETLPALLDALASQELDLTVEVVAVDSGSTDGTAALLRERADRFEPIDPATFGHGRTRNLGLSLCGGELVVLLVQDAIPADCRTLAELLRPLRDDPRVAGSFARQVPRPGASAVTRRNLSGWFAAEQLPRRSRLAPGESLADLAPWERYRLCAFDDVASCVRRSVWEDHPFPDVPIAEDLAWSRDVLAAGHEVAFAPRARVLHSHERPARYEARRAFLVGRELRRLFGLRLIASPAGLATTVGGALVAHASAVAAGGRLRELPRAARLAIAWPLGHYLGELAAGRQGRDRPEPVR